MRPGNQNNKRLRGRGGRKGPNPLSRTYESNGPDVKIRGTAHHVAEKYQQLARDAAAAGDRVISENYFQHAEHYLRIIASAQQSMHQPVVLPRGDDNDDDADEQEERNERAERSERRGEREAASDSKPVMPMDAPQPFVENMPVLNGKSVPQASEDKGEARAEDGGDDEDRGRRRTRGTRGRGVRRSRAAIGEEAGADQAGEEAKPSAGASKSKSEPAALAEAAAANEGTEEKKPRARRAPRSRAAKAEAETAASDA